MHTPLPAAAVPPPPGPAPRCLLRRYLGLILLQFGIAAFAVITWYGEPILEAVVLFLLRG